MELNASFPGWAVEDSLLDLMSHTVNINSSPGSSIKEKKDIVCNSEYRKSTSAYCVKPSGDGSLAWSACTRLEDRARTVMFSHAGCVSEQSFFITTGWWALIKQAHWFKDTLQLCLKYVSFLYYFLFWLIKKINKTYRTISHHHWDYMPRWFVRTPTASMPFHLFLPPFPFSFIFSFQFIVFKFNEIT